MLLPMLLGSMRLTRRRALLMGAVVYPCVAVLLYMLANWSVRGGTGTLGRGEGSAIVVAVFGLPAFLAARVAGRAEFTTTETVLLVLLSLVSVAVWMFILVVALVATAPEGSFS
jgi:hypothetical protein